MRTVSFLIDFQAVLGGIILELKLSFGKSTSKNYKRALRMISEMPNYEFSEDDEVHQCCLDDSNILEFWPKIQKLYYLIRPWRSTLLLFNDGDIKNENKYYLDRRVECYKLFQKSECSERYCRYKWVNSDDDKGLFACKELINVLPTFYSICRYKSKYWYEFGSFADDSTWVIDKDAIRKAVMDEISEKFLACCPMFNTDSIDDVIGSIPDQIDLINNEFWEIKYENDPFITSITYPIGVKPIEPKSDLDKFLESVEESIDKAMDESQINEQDTTSIDDMEMLDLFNRLDDLGKLLVMAKIVEELRRCEK